MSNWAVDFTEEEYEQISNFARLAGFISPRAAILALFSLRKERESWQEWRYCPSCGAEYEVKSFTEEKRKTLLELIQGFGVIHYEGKRLRCLSHNRFRVALSWGVHKRFKGERKALEALCGEQMLLRRFIYESGLPWVMKIYRYEIKKEGKFFLARNQDDEMWREAESEEAVVKFITKDKET